MQHARVLGGLKTLLAILLSLSPSETVSNIHHFMVFCQLVVILSEA